ncbi:MAG: hypothetical protein E7423_02045 [Ruminococcaceae bacterium]|nr:hypothetical protein [Oscillospiraceae bacterium]
MSKRNIDRTKHLDYSGTAARGLRKRLREKYGEAACERLMERLDRRYEAFLEDQPYCGGRHNVMIWQLYDAIALFAYYEVLPEKESLEEFRQTCMTVFGKDRARRTLPRFLTADSPAFLRLLKAVFRVIAKRMNRALDSGEWQDGWRIELETDRLPEGLQASLVGCPIWNFAVRHGYEHLMPALCNCDFPGIDFLHAGLIRPRAVSNGDDRCDNWYVSADSPALRACPPILRENGLLVSKDWRDR